MRVFPKYYLSSHIQLVLHNDAFPAILLLKAVHCMSSGLVATRGVFGLTHFRGTFSAKKSRGDCHSKYSLESMTSLLLHLKEPLYVLNHNSHGEGIHCTIRCLARPCSSREPMFLPTYLHVSKTQTIYFTKSRQSRQSFISRDFDFASITLTDFPTGYHFGNRRY